MRKPVLLIAAALVAATQLGASASPPPPVEVGNGGCDGGYDSVVNVNTTHVCARQLNPDVQITTSGCPAGYTEVGSGVVGQWVCVTV